MRCLSTAEKIPQRLAKVRTKTSKVLYALCWTPCVQTNPQRKPDHLSFSFILNSCHGLSPLALHWAPCLGHGLCLLAYKGPHAVGHVQFVVHLVLSRGSFAATGGMWRIHPDCLIWVILFVCCSRRLSVSHLGASTLRLGVGWRTSSFLLVACAWICNPFSSNLAIGDKNNRRYGRYQHASSWAGVVGASWERGCT